MADAAPVTASGQAFESIRALEDSRDAVAHIDLLYAQWCRESAKEATDGLQTTAQGVDILLPDRSEAASLGFGYSASQALTELNGAMVRIADALDDIESIPDGTDISTNAVPVAAEAKIRAALVASYDLRIKIAQWETQVPSEWDRLGAKVRQAGAGVGDVFSSALEGFLDKVVTNLWFWLAVVGVVLFFVYFRGPAKLAGAVAA